MSVIVALLLALSHHLALTGDLESIALCKAIFVESRTLSRLVRFSERVIVENDDFHVDHAAPGFDMLPCIFRQNKVGIIRKVVERIGGDNRRWQRAAEIKLTRLERSPCGAYKQRASDPYVGGWRLSCVQDVKWNDDHFTNHYSATSQFFKMQIGAQLALRSVTGNPVRLPHRLRGLTRVLHGLQRRVERSLHKPNADAGDYQGEQRNHGARKGAVGGALLGAQILFGASLLLGGFYFFIDAFKRSIRLSPGAGALRVGLGCLAIGCGGLLATFGLASI